MDSIKGVTFTGMKYFIWDFDGTLYDTYPIILAAIMKVLENHGVAADSKTVYKMLKEFSSKKVAETYGIDFEQFAKEQHAIEDLDTRVPKPFPGVKETLAAIKAGGGRQFIMTHRMADDTRSLLEKDDLAEYFEAIVGPEMKFARKPDPEAVLYLVNKYQMDPASSVMIGDRIMDVEAGNSAGIHSCFFDNEDVLEHVAADFVCHTPQEIIALLEK
ncbi:HAD-IA family hydrolase [Candidatus Enterococcus leclercqii]|uniref:HAD-IA family hydrolase n=1 Tax=Candidatus Enterococcus leclercqii TaxID=1857218 RepID=UPI001EFFA13B|nr:HAD-IA family hydrolase [Enterococcus sp. CU9D]